MSSLLKIVVLAALYYVTGRAGLLLAIQPGNATVFWPASGVALAFVYLYGYRVFPGIFIGSFLLNFFSYFGVTPSEDIPVLALNAAANGVGASLQAIIGVFLLHTFVGKTMRLAAINEILKFSVIAGPLVCLISASFSVFVLVLTDTIPISNASFVWSTWYAGDTLGVLVFAPILILLLSSENVSSRRKLSVALPLALTFVIIISLFWMVRDNDRDAQLMRFKGDVNLIEGELQKEFDTFLLEVESLKGFYDASNYVDRHEFKTFVRHFLDTNKSVNAVAWSPRVLKEMAAYDAFLEVAKNEGFSDFKIKPMDVEDPVPAADVQDYFPVLFVEPFARAKRAQGLDLGSSRLRRDAIEVARDTGKPSATTPIMLYFSDDIYGFLIFDPIYQKDNNAFMGVVYGVYEYGRAIEKIIEPWRKEGIGVRLKAKSSDGYMTVYDSGVARSVESTDLKLSLPFYFAQQKWVFEFFRDPAFLLDNVNWSLWYLLLGSLTFAFLTSVFLLSVTGTASVMEETIEEKTKEISSKNKFLNVIMDNVPDFIFVKNDQFELVQANKALIEKYPPEQRDTIIGTTGLEQFPEDEREIYLANDKKALTHGYAENEETNTDYTGYTRTLFTKKVRFYDDEGNPFILGVARDVTDFITTKKKLETILDTTADGLVTIRENGIIETYNKACEEIFGYSAEEAIGENISILMPEEYARDHGAHIHRYIQTGKSSVIGGRRELQAKRKNGEIFPIELSVAEVKLGSRRIFSGVVRDIAERKKAQEQAQQIAQIFSSALVEFYIFDAEHYNLLLVNAGAVQNMGYSEEELLGLKIYDIHNDFGQEDFAELLRPLVQEEQDKVELNASHIRKDESSYDVLMNIQLTRFRGRDAFIATILDVTEQRQYLEELKRSNKELENFAYVTSHDLKAPLRHISMSAGFFKQKFGDLMDEKAHELLETMTDGTERMQNMIESLLAYSRVGRGDMELKKLDLNKAVVEARKNLSAEISTVDAEVEVGTLPHVHADKFLMTQLLQNLMQNALKYKEEGTTPVIKIEAQQRAKEYEISVSDNGIGIKPEYAEKVFQIFQRLHRDNEYEGVGIGLSICQRIVEFHDGRIWVDPDYQDGARFVFTLPIVYES